jgi:hypothetical protein
VSHDVDVAAEDYFAPCFVIQDKGLHCNQANSICTCQ